MFDTTPEEVLQSNDQGPIDIDPRLGLEFDTDKSAINFYNDYARRIGFSIQKEYVNINKKLGYVTSRKLTCYKEGFHEDDKRKYQAKIPRKETRTGCQAHIIITRQPVGKYHITKVELEHNHPLVPPARIHMLPSHRKINNVQTHEIDLAEDARLFSKATFDYMSLQAGGRANLGYTKLDHKKNVKAENINKIEEQYREITNSKLTAMNRYRIMCPTFVRLAAKASETDEGYKLAMTLANEFS